MMRGFGKFVPDNNAKTAFETFQINPDYRYYITGSDNKGQQMEDDRMLRNIPIASLLKFY